MSDNRFTARDRELRRRRVKRVALGVLVVIVASTLAWVVWFSALLSVRDVEVSGVTTVKTAQVRAAASVPVGRPLARLDLAEISARVKTMERVESVDVSRSWPHTVRIEVVERTAVMRTVVDGEVRGVDRYGIDFRSYDKAPKDLLEATVTDADPRRRQQTTAAVASVVRLIETKDADLRTQVRSVKANSKDSIEFTLTGGRSIVWGSEADGARKLTVLDALLKIKASRYDVSAPDQPTTRR